MAYLSPARSLSYLQLGIVSICRTVTNTIVATKTTYHVQGIPAHASLDDIEVIISKALGEDAIKLDPTIHSLGSTDHLILV